MSERTITIHVKNDVSLAKMMAAIFKEYEPSIEKIELKGVDTPVDHKVLHMPHNWFGPHR